MNAVDYLKEKARMTNGCNILCKECPLDKYNLLETCKTIEFDYPEEAIEIFEKWAKENPVRTYLSVLLEKLPNTQLEYDGTPNFCPQQVFKIKIKPAICDITNCFDCWNREYKEEE